MGVFTVFYSLMLLVAASGKETMVSLEDVERLLQQSQAAMVENMDTLASKVSELTDQVNQLQASQVAGSSAKKRLVLNGEIDLEQAIVTLGQKINALQTSSGSGAVYTRWGRTTCPGNGTDLVYSGTAAGSAYGNKGGGSNYLCLPTDPTWGHHISGQQFGADISGAEYQFDTGNGGRSTLFSGSATEDDDVPCAVCRSTRPSAVMIPGRNICYSGWSKEYSGYLVGEASGYDSSEFVCMDGAPEAVPGGGANKNGALFYVAEVNCGSLTCPPYKEGYELTCVVCTK